MKIHLRHCTALFFAAFLAGCAAHTAGNAGDGMACCCQKMHHQMHENTDTPADKGKCCGGGGCPCCPGKGGETGKTMMCQPPKM